MAFVLFAVLAATGLVSSIGAKEPDPEKPLFHGLPSIPVRILSFNVCGGVCPRKASLASWVTTLTAGLSRHKVDVLLLQELCRAQYESLALELSGGSPGPRYLAVWTETVDDDEKCRQWGETRQRGGETRFGNAILIRDVDAVQDRRTWRLPGTGETEQRALTCVQAALPDTGRVRVCNVHIDHHSAVGAQQAGQVARLADGWAGTEPVLLGGDFNLYPDHPALSALYAPPGGAGAFREVDDTDAGRFPEGCEKGPCRSGEGTYHGKKIDYIFASGRHFAIMDAYPVAELAPLSDHLPLLGVVAHLPPAGGQP
ncbi:hypothetical protein CS0771_17220 [Catellatospora sp. IY07-71]|nr:hypothetical protein CS0771_17220 [Catellatospora sp. IY07-71]